MSKPTLITLSNGIIVSSMDPFLPIYQSITSTSSSNSNNSSSNNNGSSSSNNSNISDDTSQSQSTIITSPYQLTTFSPTTPLLSQCFSSPSPPRYITTLYLPLSLPLSPRLPFKNGVIVCPSQFPLQERNIIRALITAATVLGEEAYTETLTRQVTHLICGTRHSEKVIKAKEWGIAVVTCHWLIESLYAGVPLDENLFQVK